MTNKRIAVVTGGGSGNGAEIARRLGADGYAVAVVDIDTDGARRVAGEIEAAGGEAVVMKCDVTDAASCAALASAVKESHGGVDVLVNNAGIGLWGTVESADDDEWDRVMSVNVKGIFHVTRAIIPLMKGRSGASIINIGSGAGVIGVQNSLAYCASKGAVHSMTRAMALDHAAEGIRVNTVAPGVVDTPFNDKVLATMANPEEVRKAQANAHPLGRLGTPVDVANVVAFLASDQASFITGSTLMADGGLTAQ